MSGSGTPGTGGSGRRQCPTCGAARRGEVICHRCRSDLTLLLRVEDHVDRLRTQARRCYARGWYRQAADVAGRIVTLEATVENLTFLACAKLMCGDFPAALRASRQVHRAAPGNHESVS